MKNTCYLFLFISLFLVSCGTTQLIVSDGQSDIYVNQVYKGKGQAEIKRMGPPKTIHVEARKSGIPIYEQKIKRKFDYATFLVGYLTYGTGFIWGWRFPETIMIPIAPATRFDENKSVWDQPSTRWKR